MAPVPKKPVRKIADGAKRLDEAIAQHVATLADATLSSPQRVQGAAELIETGRRLQSAASELRSQIVQVMLAQPGRTMPAVAEELGASVSAVAKIAHKGRYPRTPRDSSGQG